MRTAVHDACAARIRAKGYAIVEGALEAAPATLVMATCACSHYM